MASTGRQSNLSDSSGRLTANDGSAQWVEVKASVLDLDTTLKDGTRVFNSWNVVNVQVIWSGAWKTIDDSLKTSLYGATNYGDKTLAANWTVWVSHVDAHRKRLFFYETSWHQAAA